MAIPNNNEDKHRRWSLSLTYYIVYLLQFQLSLSIIPFCFERESIIRIEINKGGFTFNVSDSILFD